MDRTRTVTWRDPALGFETANTLTGVEYLRAMARGDAPPLPSVTIETGKLFCSGEIVHVGKRTATAEGRLIDSDGKLYAHATGTFMITGPDDRKGR